MVHIITPLVSPDDESSSASFKSTSRSSDLSDFLNGLEPTLKARSVQFADGDEQLARDLYQEGAIAAIGAVFRYNPAIGTLEGFAAWRAINRMRDVKRAHTTRAARTVPECSEDDPCLCDEGAVAALVDAIDAANLRPLLKHVLTNRQREVVEAIYYLGLTSSETGLLLRISAQRVNQLHVLAVKRLRGALRLPASLDSN